MDVVHILGPRKALKRSKPMPNFGLPSNRPCSAGTLLKRTNGEVNIPKLMTRSTASKFEPTVKEQCLRLVAPTQQTKIVYQAQVTRDNVRENNGSVNQGKPRRIPVNSSRTATNSASTSNAADSVHLPVPKSSPNTSKLAVPTKSTSDQFTVLSSASAKPLAVVHTKPPLSGSIIKPQRPQTIIDMNANTGNLSLGAPNPNPDSIILIGSSKLETREPPLPPANPPSIELIGTSKRELGNRSKLSMNSNKSLRSQPLEPPEVTDNNAGGDFNQLESSMHQLPSGPGSGVHPAETSTLTIPVSMSSIGLATSSKTTQPEEKKAPREPTSRSLKSDSGEKQKTVPTSSKHSSKNKAELQGVQADEDSDCQEPQMIMSNNGAIRFQLPGRVQHKTTIKLAHYPENKTGETIVINVPEGEKDSCSVENSPNGPPPQNWNFNPGQPNLPPPPPHPGNIPGIEFPPNMPNNYQPQFYNPGNSINGQNFYYPQSQQQYANNFDYGFMNGGLGFTRNDPYNYYSGPPPQPPPQNYQPYGYGYPN